jgi:16S rRNA (guanine527-N7)-methyltransferase
VEAPAELLKRGFIELGIAPEAEIIAAFELYRQELKKWNQVHNITAITDDHEIVMKHFLDSLLYLKAIPAAARTICDVGSGGGFPGLPIAIVRPDLGMTLIEPNRKKAGFLKQLRRLLDRKDIEVIEDRIDDVAERQFDVVLTRATFTAAELINKAGHAVGPGGLLLLSKGPKYEEEIPAIPDAYRVDLIPARLDTGNLSRNLLTIRRA